MIDHSSFSSRKYGTKLTDQFQEMASKNPSSPSDANSDILDASFPVYNEVHRRTTQIVGGWYYL